VIGGDGERIRASPSSITSWSVCAALPLVGGAGDGRFALAGAVRADVRALDSMAAVTKVSTVAAELGQSLAAWRFQSLLLVLFAALALVLAAVGVFGLIKLWSVALMSLECE